MKRPYYHKCAANILTTFADFFCFIIDSKITLHSIYPKRDDVDSDHLILADKKITVYSKYVQKYGERLNPDIMIDKDEVISLMRSFTLLSIIFSFPNNQSLMKRPYYHECPANILTTLADFFCFITDSKITLHSIYPKRDDVDRDHLIFADEEITVLSK